VVSLLIGCFPLVDGDRLGDEGVVRTESIFVTGCSPQTWRRVGETWTLSAVAGCPGWAVHRRRLGEGNVLHRLERPDCGTGLVVP
jgi:hypothetical protein